MIYTTLCFCVFFVLFRAQNTASITPISLNVQSKDEFIGFTVQVEIADVSTFGPQQLLVDTGSSATVFCDNGLRTINKGGAMTYPGSTNVMYLDPQNEQCTGGPFVVSGTYGNKPDQMYYWGYVYEGDLWITSHYENNNNTHMLSQVAYAIAEEVGPQFLCTRAPGFDGIWGIGLFRSGNAAHVVIPNSRYSPARNVLCFEQPCNSTTFDPVNDWCYCDGTSSTFFYLEPPVTKMLNSSDDQLFGIYLATEVSKFTKLVQGRITYNAGMLFVGNSAIYNNTYYDINSVHATVESSNTDHFWNLPITSMQVICNSSKTQSSSSTNNSKNIMWMRSYCLKHGCILDSGTKIALPCSIIDQINACNTANHVDRSISKLNINMVGGTLQVNLRDLQTLHDGGWIQSSESYGGTVILGFPVWLLYYIVFDFSEGIEGKATLSFASIQK